jgi:iron(III) transport system permease protein
MVAEVMTGTARPRSRRRRPAEWIAAVPAAFAIALLVPIIFLPLFLLVYGSTLDTQSATESGRVTFQHFAEIARDRGYRTSLLHSLELALATGLGAGVVGVVIAWIVVHVRPPAWRVFDTLMVVPFFLSPFVLAIAWSFLGNPSNGLINAWLSKLLGTSVAPISIYSFWGIAFVLVTAAVPFVYMLVSAALASSDPSLEEAAAMSGASRFSRLTTITLPLVAPSILAGVFFAVVFALEAFAEPAILGAAIRYNTLMTDVFYAVQSFPTKYGTASALAVVVMSITMVLVYFQSRLLGERSFVSLSGKSGSSADVSRGYGRAARTGLMLVPLIYLVVAVGLPYLVLTLVSLQPFASPDITRLSFANYRAFLSDPTTIDAFRNSGLAAAGAVVVSMVWMFMLAYVLRKARFPGSRLIGHLAMLRSPCPAWSWASRCSGCGCARPSRSTAR